LPRIRSIKPEITSDRKFATVSRDARLVFIYTWTICDDDGLFRAETRQLLGDLVPFEPEVSPSILRRLYGELTEIGVIGWRETVDGSLVGEVVNWGKHQHIKNRSKSFLLTQLSESSPDPTEALRRIDGGATEALGVRSLESRALSLEPRVNTRPPRTAAAVPEWVDALLAIWTAHVGRTTAKKIHTSLKDFVDEYGFERVRAALEVYVSPDEGPTGARKPEWFSENFHKYRVISETALVDKDGVMTERGRKLMARSA
jgi:hypothetical protein